MAHSADILQVVSEPPSPGKTQKRVALQVSRTIEAGLKARLTVHQPLFIDLEQALSELDAPALVILEVGDDDAALVQRLLTANHLQETPTLLIGPAGNPLVATRPLVQELSADVGLWEVLRLARNQLYGHPSSPLQSVPPPSVALPGSGGLGPSQPSSSLLSSPAPLLPPSAPPNSRPSDPAAMSRAAPASLPRSPGDGLDAPPSALSEELTELLALAEQRLSEEQAPRASLPADPAKAELELSPEMLAALDAPIGEYAEEGGLSMNTGDSFRSTRTGGEQRTGSASEGPGGANGVPAPSALPSSAGLSVLPPRTSPSPPLPPAPGLPKGSWVGQTLDPTGERNGAASSDSRSPATLADNRTSPEQAKGLQGEESPLLMEPPHSRSTSQPSDPTVAGTKPPSAVLDAPPDPRAPSSELPSSEPQSDQPAPGAFTRPQLAPIRRSTRPPSERATLHPGLIRRPTPPSSHPPPDHRELKTIPPTRPAPSEESRPRSGAPLTVTGAGDAGLRLAAAIGGRRSGTLVFEAENGVRRVVLKEGDLVTAASSLSEESLLGFLVQEGVLEATVGMELEHRVPSFGRHAGAALIAGGYMAQDQLWPMLRAHAEYIALQAIRQLHGVVAFEVEVPERLKAEPSVFGGATGCEVFVELNRRALDPEQALARLGGAQVLLAEGAKYRLLTECALAATELELLQWGLGQAIEQSLDRAQNPEFGAVVYALAQLEVIRTAHAREKLVASPSPRDELDEEALRRLVSARRSLVDNGDYFAVLGLPRNATGYEVRRAYAKLKQSFVPQVLTPNTLDLADDLELILEVAEEAYAILGDTAKRQRYRTAIESIPI